MTMLDKLIAEAKARGLMGVAVFDQGGPRGKVAVTMSLQGEFTDRSWDTHATADEALADLAGVLQRNRMRDPKYVPGVLQRNRMRDPKYVPTVEEALSDPEGFVEGMTETNPSEADIRAALDFGKTVDQHLQ